MENHGVEAEGDDDAEADNTAKVDNDDGDGHSATDWWYPVVSVVAEIRLGCVKGVDDVKHDTDEAGI